MTNSVGLCSMCVLVSNMFTVKHRVDPQHRPRFRSARLARPPPPANDSRYDRDMCGRYRPTVSWAEIHRLYRLTLDQPAMNLAPVYNAAPTMSLPVVRQNAEGHCRVDS